MCVSPLLGQCLTVRVYTRVCEHLSPVSLVSAYKHVSARVHRLVADGLTALATHMVFWLRRETHEVGSCGEMMARDGVTKTKMHNLANV